MKRLLRAVCLVLCWTLLMAGMPGKASAEEAAPMVRVLLRRLQLTDRADLTLAGAYTVRVGGDLPDVISTGIFHENTQLP